MLTTDLCLVTFPGHYCGLPYLFRSIEKYVAGFRRLIVVIEDQDPVPPLPDFAVLHRCRNYRGTNYWGRGGQQIEKLRAFQRTDAERIVYVDSDTVFVRPVDIQTDPCFSLEKPPVIWRTWNEAGDAICWYEPTKMVLGFEPPYETMTRFPFTFPRWFLEEYWGHVGGEDRLKIFAHPNEFNGLGNYALVKHLDHFTAYHAWDGVPEGCMWQYSITVNFMEQALREKLQAFGLMGTTT